MPWNPQVQEDALRLLEIKQLNMDMAQEKFLAASRLWRAHPILLEGGSILVGVIKVYGRLIKTGDASKWERANLPKTTTGMLVKIGVVDTSKKEDGNEQRNSNQ